MAAIKDFIFKFSLLIGNKIDLGDVTPTDMVILVIGPCGAGKSEFIHHASGINKDEIGNGLDPKTKKVKGIKCVLQLEGQTSRSVVLVDTPGINLELPLVQQIPVQCSKHNIEIAGILYLHPVSNTRLNENPETHLATLRTLGALCGWRDLQKALLVTTDWQPTTEQKNSAPHRT